MAAHRIHCMDFGAEPRPDGTVRFRLWAPAIRDAELVLADGPAAGSHPMRCEAGGWFECALGQAPPGTRYRFRLDDGLSVADPASRYQPQDVLGPSEVVDPAAFAWDDEDEAESPANHAPGETYHVPAHTFVLFVRCERPPGEQAA